MRKTFQSETRTLERVMLKPVSTGFQHQASIDAQWQSLNYLGKPDYEKALLEYEAFENIFKQEGVEVVHFPAADHLSLDSIYCRDASIMTDFGAIICNMGKGRRKDEPRALEKAYESLGIPILGAIHAPATLEGGDTNWIDPHTLAVGQGYRTNAAGITQLKALAKDKFEVLEVHLPHAKGPSDVFHLMSILSPIDDDLFLVYSPLMSVPFRKELLSRGITLVEVPDEEFESQGCNVLTFAPRKCIVLEGNPQTRARLEAHGVEVHTYQGEEISLKGCGGPTCLTRPMQRFV